MLIGIRSQWAIREFIKTWSVILACAIGLQPLSKCMEHLSSLDTSLNQSQPESSFIIKTNTTTKASARKMDSKKGSTTGTLTGQVKDDGLTCYNCGQVGYISGKCPNCNMMKKLLEQALVGKDAPKAKSGRPPKT